jgi:hypothetical protein
MRSSWFRGRFPLDDDGRVQQEDASSALVDPADAAETVPPPPAPPAPPATRALDATRLPAVRPVHGHPTF